MVCLAVVIMVLGETSSTPTLWVGGGSNPSKPDPDTPDPDGPEDLKPKPKPGGHVPDKVIGED